MESDADDKISGQTCVNVMEALIDPARPEFYADASLRVASQTWFDICVYCTRRYHTNESDLKRSVFQEARQWVLGLKSGW